MKTLHIDRSLIKILSSSTKFNVLKLLHTKEQNIKHLARQLNLSQPTIIGHIKELQKANLIIRKQREGRIFVTYTITEPIHQLFNTKELPVTISLQ